MRAPTLWVDIRNQHATGLPRIQACVRGWILRNRLKLAGPGVLSRKNLVNDEELVSGNEKERQHPLDYFAFEENSKVWWFSFSSIWKLSAQNFEPSNPYTKEPLSKETRNRIRAIWAYNNRNGISHIEESNIFEDRLRTRLNNICQTFVDHGFTDVRPNAFIGFRRADYSTAFVLLSRDIETVYSAHAPFREKALRLCHKMTHECRHLENHVYVLHSLYILKWLLSLHKDPYVMSFSILSALYRC
jgi:hypothetical protein